MDINIIYLLETRNIINIKTHYTKYAITEQKQQRRQQEIKKVSNVKYA